MSLDGKARKQKIMLVSRWVALRLVLDRLPTMGFNIEMV